MKLRIANSDMFEISSTKIVDKKLTIRYNNSKLEEFFNLWKETKQKIRIHEKDKDTKEIEQIHQKHMYIMDMDEDEAFIYTNCIPEEVSEKEATFKFYNKVKDPNVSKLDFKKLKMKEALSGC